MLSEEATGRSSALEATVKCALQGLTTSRTHQSGNSLLEGETGDTLKDAGVGEDFLSRAPGAQEIPPTICQRDPIKSASAEPGQHPAGRRPDLRGGKNVLPTTSQTEDLCFENMKAQELHAQIKTQAKHGQRK